MTSVRKKSHKVLTCDGNTQKARYTVAWVDKKRRNGAAMLVLGDSLMELMLTHMAPTPDGGGELLNLRQLARLLGTSRATAKRLSQRGEIPAPIIGRAGGVSARWSRRQVGLWLEKGVVKND